MAQLARKLPPAKSTSEAQTRTRSSRKTSRK
jgi:hypothetical protein